MHVSDEAQDTCVSYEEEDTCVSYEEEDTCVSDEAQDTCMAHNRFKASLLRAPPLHHTHTHTIISCLPEIWGLHSSYSEPAMCYMRRRIHACVI
jgi:hypothetical protein